MSPQGTSDVPPGVKGRCFHETSFRDGYRPVPHPEALAERRGLGVLSVRELCRIDTESEDIPGIQGLQFIRCRLKFQLSDICLKSGSSLLKVDLTHQCGDGER